MKHVLCAVLVFALFGVALGNETQVLDSGVPVLSPAEKAADLSAKGKMKDHYRKGMQFFSEKKYDKALPELIAATMIVDPFTWSYWYAEAYATIGLIYEFHDKSPDHDRSAYQYYSLALKRDPKTKTARFYIDRVRPKVVSKAHAVLSNQKDQ
jgi:hypothetical protein